jgi:hypothetical protein
MVAQTVRFKVATGAFIASVTVNDLLDMFVLATGTTSGYRLVDSIKLRKVEAWSPAAAGSFSTISIEDSTDSSVFGGRSRIVSDSTTGSARPAHIVWKPHPGTIQDSFFSVSSTTKLYDCSFPQGSIVDLHFTFYLHDASAAASAPVTALVGAVSGVLYVRAFGVSASMSNVIPVSFPTGV